MDVTYSIQTGNVLCIPCHPDCNGCTGHPQNCVGCNINTSYLDASLGISICTPCKSPCVACQALTECTSCVPGYYLIGLACQKCDSSCLTCSGPSSNDCLSCFGTSNLSPTGTCNGCSSTCSICNADICSGCMAGYFLYSGNCLSSCPPATYAKASSCVLCDSTCAVCNATACQ